LVLLPSVSAAILDNEGRLLLARHAQGDVWAIPGGTVEPDESPSDAIAREVREEVGLVVEPIRVLGVYGGPEFRVTYENGDQVSYVMTVIECRIIGGELRSDGAEVLEAKYASVGDVAELKLPSWAHVVLPEVFDGR
jgi:ADP-ribose pyrophosphatase YjhB (NUDIX family)